MNARLLKGYNLPILLSGMLVTAILSLSIHVVMLQVLNIPYPSVKIHAPTADFLSKTVLSILAFIYLAQFAAPALARQSRAVQCGILFAIWMGLLETTRGAFMEGYCTDAFTYAFATKIPELLPPLIVAAVVVSSSGWLDTAWKKVAAALALGALLKFVLVPLSAFALKAPLASLAFLAPQGEWCQLPYGLNVLIPAYLTFIEPTLACVTAAALVWPRLSGNITLRIVQFIVLIVSLNKILLASFVYMLYAHLPPLTALASMGQFALESLLLAAGIGLTWAWVSRRDVPAQLQKVPA